MATIRNCRLPEDLFYDVEHDQWARVLPNGVVEFGLTDPGQTLAGKFQCVSFLRKPQDRVPAGKGLAMLESAKWLAPFRATADGEVVAVNAELLDKPMLVNVDPYDDGWVVRFLPDKPLDWLHGQPAQEAYATRLEGTFRSVAGINDDFWCVHCADWSAV